MPLYKYEVRDGAGAIHAGTLESPSLAEATSQLRAAGGFLLNVAPTAAAKDLLTRIRTFKVEFGPGLKDVQSFTNQLAVMIKAGINIRNAIGGIAEQVENPKFKAIIERMKADVESGQPFSEALAHHPKIFSPLYVNMVRASEMSGNFGHMLHRISNYLGQQVETRSMVRGAMVYPCIIGFMAVFTTVFLLTFVLPKFSALFAGKESLLPLPTKVLLGISAFLRHYWYIVILGLGGSFMGLYYYVKTPTGRVLCDRFMLRMPIVKKMLRALYITRGMHTMGELISAGVPMLETIKITSDISGNAVYQEMWGQVYTAVKQGEKIAQPLAKQPVLPRNVVQMISAGEESGKLGEVLQDVAEFYAGELRNAIKSMTAMLEPLMIMIMGLVVGFIAMSIILPIFKMSSLVK
ncbi:MAG: type II secretion system F family protein [Phycisphaerae bacterium]|jgi:type IV pilus assembly protein PilC